MALEDILFAFQIRRGRRPSDVADGEGEDAFPGGAVGARVGPAIGEGVLGAGGGGGSVVGEAGDVVGVEGGGDDVLGMLLIRRGKAPRGSMKLNERNMGKRGVGCIYVTCTVTPAYNPVPSCSEPGGAAVHPH